MMKRPRVKYIICCLILTLIEAIRLAMDEKVERVYKQREPACQCRRHKRRTSDPWLGKIPERRRRQPTPALVPGESMDRGACWAAVHGVAESGASERPSTRACTNSATAILLSQVLKNYLKFWVFLADM